MITKWLMLFAMFFLLKFLKVELSKGNLKCIRVDSEDNEFKISPGGYSVDSINQSECKSLCFNYNYAAITTGKYCFCGDELPDKTVENINCDARCKQNEECGSLNSFYYTVLTTKEIFSSFNISLDVKYNCTGLPVDIALTITPISDVEIIIYFGDKTPPIKTLKPTLNYEKYYKIPGTYIIEVLVKNIGQNENDQFVLKRKKILIDECKIDIELKCPEFIMKYGTADCVYEIWRGSSLSLTLKTDNYEDRNYSAIPGPRLFAIGIPIPPEFTEDMISRFFEAYFHYANFPIGRITGFEFFSLKPENLEIQVLRPICVNTRYCIYYGVCYEDCSTVNDDKNCIVNYSPGNLIKSSCSESIPADVNFEIKYKKEIKTIYGYNNIEIDEIVEVQPGDIVGFKSKKSIIPSKNISGLNSYSDTDKSGKSLNVRHYFRVLAVESAKYHAKYTFNESGLYDVAAEVFCSNTDSSSKFQTVVRVLSDFEYFKASVNPSLIAVGDEYIVSIVTSGGFDVDLIWDYKNGTKEQEFITNIPSIFNKTIVCLEEGTHVIEVIGSNDVDNVNDTVTLTCMYPVTNDWNLTSNSPQCIPPGNITFTLVYPVEKNFPTEGISKINYGVDDTYKDVRIPTTGIGSWETSFVYTYRFINDYNVTMIIKNEISEIYLTLDVTINQCILNFTVNPTFVPEGKLDPDDRINLVGPYDYDAPIDRPFYFEMQLEHNYYDYFLVKFPNGTLLKNSTEKLIDYKFNEAGIYDFCFYLYYGNGENGPVNKTVRILNKVQGLYADDTNNGFCYVEVGVNFTIYIEQFDEFTCLLFDVQDGSIPIAYGDEVICNYSYNKEFHYEDNIVSSNMTQYHKFETEGDFIFKIEVFNSISSESKEVIVGCEMTENPDIRIVEIVSAKRTCRKPSEWLRSQSIHLHSITIFNITDRNRYFREWNIFEVDVNGITIRELDTTSLLRKHSEYLYIPPRYFEIGFYKVSVTITIKKLEGSDFLYLGNGSDHTCLKINRTPFGVWILEDGTSYIRRGIGQLIYMNPLNFSSDPDNPEEMNFDVFWFCYRTNTNERLLRDNITYVKGNWSSPILNKKDKEGKQDKGGCFGDGPGSITLDHELYFNTEWLWGINIIYEIAVVLQNENKTAEGHLQIELIEEISPPILLRCKRKFDCHPLSKSLLLNSPKPVIFHARCEDECRNATFIKYEWEITMRSFETEDTITLTNYSEIIFIYHQQLALTELFYKMYPEYIYINVTVKAYILEYEVMGVSKLILTINRPPIPGKCELKPEIGYALIDTFLFSCSDWSDPDESSIKSYHLYLHKNKTSYYLLWNGVAPITALVLPFGFLDLYVRVTDFYGAETMIFSSSITTILPTQEEVRQWNETNYFQLAVNNSDINLASQIISAYTSVLIETDEILENFNENPFENEESEMIQEIKINQTWTKYKELEGIDSSYFTIQAWKEVKDMVKDFNEEKLELFIKRNNNQMKLILSLPITTTEDAIIAEGALSMLSMNGPMDKDGLTIMLNGIEEIFGYFDEIQEYPTGDKAILYDNICNIMDRMVSIFAKKRSGNLKLRSDIKEAEEYLEFNATQPNPFIYFVEDKSAEETKHDIEIIYQKEAIKESNEMAEKTMEKVNDILNCIKSDVLDTLIVTGPPWIINTESGLNLYMNRASMNELSELNISQGHAIFDIPNACEIFFENGEDCTSNFSDIGIVAMKWNSLLNSYVKDLKNIPDGTSTIILEFSNENKKSYDIQNTTEPFQICIPRWEDIKAEKISPPFEKSKFENTRIIMHHCIPLINKDIAVVVDIKPINDMDENIIIIYKIGAKPSFFSYDGLFKLKGSNLEDDAYHHLIKVNKEPEPNKTFCLGLVLVENIENYEMDENSKCNLTDEDLLKDFESFIYHIRIYSTGCYYFNNNSWSTDGCEVASAKVSLTCCYCNHLTMFGGGFVITPNTINFDYVFLNADFDKNISIYVTLIVSFSLYIIILIWARWKDRKDVEKLGVTPLPDNDINDKYFYEILVFTGHQKNAGTKSKVYFLVSGDDDETGVRILRDDERPILQTKGIDAFVMAVPSCLGNLNYLRIWHDNSGSGSSASWYLLSVVFRDVQTGLRYEFIVNKWFAVEKDDGMIDRLIPVAGKEQLTEFSYLFSVKSRKGLMDGHLWLSVFLRPHRSRFTRVQRVSCCMAVLYLSMLANAMWYGRVPDQQSGSSFKFGPFILSPEQVAVGVASNFIIFPPTFIMIFFFRKSRRRKLRPSHIKEAIQKQRSHIQLNNIIIEEKNVTQSKNGTKSEIIKASKKRKTFSLPWWCVFFGWFFVIASIFGSVFFLWAYGIQFGDVKTSKWVTSLLISFFSSLLLTQPLKIFLTACLISMICQKLKYDDDDDDADEDEEDHNLDYDEKWLHIKSTDKKPLKKNIYRPLDEESLEKAREKREKEVKMQTILREAIAYSLYLWILIIISYGQRDPNSYYMRLNLINNFIKPGDLWNDFNKVNTDRRFWNWTTEALIPELLIGNWYNDRIPLGLREFIDDKINIKISYAVMRQVRIKPNNCFVVKKLNNIINDCSGHGGIFSEDSNTYARGWNANYLINTSIPPEYRYLTASQLKGYPFWGKMDYYGGGGYVVPLFGKKEKVYNTVERLKKDSWIDKYTRAIFIEISVYNAQVNLFGAVTILAEFLPGGGISPYYHIDPIRLLFYHTKSGFFTLTCEIIFVIFNIYFTFREIRKMIKLGKSYFDEYWNISEVANLMFAYSGIGMNIYRFILTQRILKIFTKTKGTGYVKLQEAVLLDSCYGYAVGFLIFVATLKFLRLLRFNKRTSIVSATLKKCAEELRSYGVCLMIVFCAFVILFWLLLGRFMWEFSTFILSFESCISMLLKKSKYTEMAEVSPFSVPIAFFIFSIVASMVLINILLTLILQNFEFAKNSLNEKKNELEIIQMIKEKIKVMVGKTRIQPVIINTMKKNQDTISEFPEKVDKLLHFINYNYFDSQMVFKRDIEQSQGKRKPKFWKNKASEKVRQKFGAI